MAFGDPPSTGASTEPTTTLDSANTFLGGITDDAASKHLANSQVISAGYGIVASAAVGARPAIQQATNAMGDFANMNTPTTKFKEVASIFESSTVGTLAYSASLTALKTMMDAAGMGSVPLLDSFGKLTTAAKESIIAFSANADEIHKWGTGMLNVAGAGGSMQEFLKQAGSDLSNFNATALENLQVQNNSAFATGITTQQMQKYAQQIALIPGGLQHMSDTMQVAGGQTTILTAAIRYAHGSGREMAEVTKDMGHAVTEYGASMEKGLEFSAHMSEASETLGARLEDTRGALQGSMDAFKSYIHTGTDVSNMTKGMTDSMESYVSRLQSVGVPAKQAIDMFNDYTKSMANMTMGQKAFLSGQTGGPGGLRGALQMEDLMEKDPEAAQKKVMETMKKMMGPIVSREQAEQSEGAAAQYQRQREMLKSGPLGAGIKDDQQASRMMEAFSKGQTISLEKKGGLEETEARGKSLEDLSRTKLDKGIFEIREAQLNIGKHGLDIEQNVGTAGQGSRGGIDAGINVSGAKEIKEYTSKAEGRTISHDDPIKEFGKLATSMPETLKDIIGSLTQNTSMNEAQKRDAEIVAMKNVVATSKNKEEVSAASKFLEASSIKPTASTDNKLYQPKDKSYYDAESLSAGAQISKEMSSPVKPTTAGAHVASAVTSGQAATSLAGAGSGHASPAHVTGGVSAGTSSGPVPVSLVGGTITVNFTGKCQHCGNNIHSSEHAAVNNAASTK